MRNLKDTFLACVFLMMGPALWAETKVLVHTDDNGVAVSGYDPVAFFEGGEPVKGLVEHRFVYKGALYLFESRNNLEAFAAEPERYEPRFGGFCPVSLSEESLKPGDPEKFRIVEGELYLLHDTAAVESFEAERLSFSDRFWKQQVEKHGLVYAPAISTP
ncbi:MAG TPA: YHS domain-containing (seleno)protein [Oceanipulchritudo sp.]|nr:YHS domain-containing (seleno)protein [Oceanipulchritudo sp.]